VFTTPYWAPRSSLQHQLPGAAHTLPQHWLYCAHEKGGVPEGPSQHTAPSAVQPSPQHSEPLPQKKVLPCRLVQFFISSMHGDPPETAYLVPRASVQHLSCVLAQVSPQQVEPGEQEKVPPIEFWQQVPPACMQVSPQQVVPMQLKKLPEELLQHALPPPRHESPQHAEFGPHAKSTP